jgi:predicted XRE-type DNA-binding protein
MRKEMTLDDVHDELQITNRLMILSLVVQGLRQKELAATLGITEGRLSQMFAKGVLKRAAQLAKSTSNDRN